MYREPDHQGHVSFSSCSKNDAEFKEVDLGLLMT